MIAELRAQFNRGFTPEKYQTFLDRLAQECGAPVPFRNSETPCFFERTLVDRMARYGKELVEQIVSDALYLDAARAMIPARFLVPGEAERPLFVQADFGLDEAGEPKLVEIQGFPSLYAYQPTLAAVYQEVFSIDPLLERFLGGLTEEGYHTAVGNAIVGGHDPENVVLLEIEPFQQKTLPDFLLTERRFGVSPVCITEVVPQGKELYYRREGRLVPIRRIYNRVIVEELVQKGITSPFDLCGDYRVEWAGHPNWYFLISKFSLPYFRHPCVPETHFLNRLATLPDDLQDWVLKPLFSFAGKGVVVGPTRADIEAITDPSEYILQRRVNFAPTIQTPEGPTKVEIRVMFLWQEGLTPLTVLLRMGRGKMMGVDHNRDMTWVGASAAFIQG